MKKQYSLELDRYSPISIGRSYLYRSYESINSFLNKNFSSDYHDLLFKPVQREKQIDFYSADNESYKTLEELSAEEKSRVLVKYNEIIKQLNRRCLEYSNSEDGDNLEWSNILSAVFDMDANLILWNGKDIGLIWGWKFYNKKNYFVPLSFSDAEEHKLEEIEIEEVEISDEAEPIEVVTEPESVSEPEPIVELEPIVEPEKVPEEFVTAEEGGLSKEVKKNWFLRFLDWIEHFFKRFWWLMLIILGIFLLLFLLSKCNRSVGATNDLSDDEVEQILTEIMPPEERRRRSPIDPEQIVEDDDSHSRILGNVLNLALKNPESNFDRFAVDLKQVFPNEKYEIVYFDESTRRIQFSFPSIERKTVRKTIEEQLSNYDLLIWDESIFESTKTMNDPIFSDGNRSWFYDVINAQEAWDRTTGDASVVIAIIDDGFDVNHEELKGKIVKPYNVITHNNVLSVYKDRNHGTHVAGIAAARANNNKGICGIAPDCNIMPIQAAGREGFFSMTDVVDGILYAINNKADIINLSLGKLFSENIGELSREELERLAGSFGVDEADFWNELFSMAEDNNVTIVMAAGNENLIVGLDPMQRSDKTIKVGAIGPDENKAWFSNYFSNNPQNGTWVSAPGVAIYSSIPGNRYQIYDGTSMSSPIVAGSIALLKSIDPGITNKEVMRAIKKSSKTRNGKYIIPILQIDRLLREVNR